jgi:hypothetical protein
MRGDSAGVTYVDGIPEDNGAAATDRFGPDDVTATGAGHVSGAGPN